MLAHAAQVALKLTPHEALLNESLVLDGQENPVWQDSRFACLLSRLRAGRQVTVAVIGGSISAGSVYGVARGEKAVWLYHSKLARALDAQFPVRGSKGNRSGHRLHNGALPATGPAWFEHCIESQLPVGAGGILSADLILIEFAVNTDGNPSAYERMLRKVLSMRRRRSLPAVLAVRLPHVCLPRALPSTAPTTPRRTPFASAPSRLRPPVCTRKGIQIVTAPNIALLLTSC